MRSLHRNQQRWPPQLKLKAAINVAGLSQRLVAAMAYDSGHKTLNEQRLSQIIRGVGKRPTATEKQTLARLLKKSVRTLFDESPDNPRPSGSREVTA